MLNVNYWIYALNKLGLSICLKQTDGTCKGIQERRFTNIKRVIQDENGVNKRQHG